MNFYFALNFNPAKKIQKSFSFNLWYDGAAARQVLLRGWTLSLSDERDRRKSCFDFFSFFHRRRSFWNWPFNEKVLLAYIICNIEYILKINLQPTLHINM